MPRGRLQKTPGGGNAGGAGAAPQPIPGEAVPGETYGGRIRHVMGARMPQMLRRKKEMGRSSRWPYVRKMAWDRDRKVRALCWICGQPIDYSLAPSSADNSWEPDHVQPVAKRPDLELDLNNIKASHRACNRSRGDGTNGNNELGQQSRIW